MATNEVTTCTGDACVHRPATTGLIPTHNFTTSKPTSPDENRRRRRRLRCCCIICLGMLLLVAVVLLVLFLTVLRVRDPTTRLVSARVVGLAPSLVPPVQFNATLLLTVAVHNPNRASFSYATGLTGLWYRGVHVADAAVDPGHIPSAGDATMLLEMTVASRSFTAEVMAELIKDVEAGSVPLDASARIPGRVDVLGVFKLQAVAYSDCHVVFGIPEMGVRSQECHDNTKL